jgi:hypothetical protein
MINCGKIILNVSAYISPIRIRDVAGNLVGEILRASGWGRTSDSKYNCLTVLYFDMKYCTYRNECFKEEETHGIWNLLWSLYIPSVYNMTCNKIHIGFSLNVITKLL